jgi:hypothetical protein
MKTIEISEQESVDIHNAVIFMANDLMEDIQELESWIKSLPPEEVKTSYREDLEYKQKRWNELVSLVEKVKR